MKTQCREDRYKGIIIDNQKTVIDNQEPAIENKQITPFAGIFTILLLCFACFLGGHTLWPIVKTVPKYIAPQSTSQLVKSEINEPPLTLEINGERWQVIPYDFEGDAWKRGGQTEGYTVCDERIIFYKPISSPSRLRENLWHEIMHASRCGKLPVKEANWYSAVNSPEHESVYELGAFLSTFTKDNQDFIIWSNN